MDSSALLEPNTEHLELRDAVSQSQDLPQLAMVPIYYSDLAGVDSDFIMLFADNTTTAKYVPYQWRRNRGRGADSRGWSPQALIPIGLYQSAEN